MPEEPISIATKMNFDDTRRLATNPEPVTIDIKRIVHTYPKSNRTRKNKQSFKNPLDKLLFDVKNLLVPEKIYLQTISLEFVVNGAPLISTEPGDTLTIDKKIELMDINGNTAEKIQQILIKWV
jgi:hypothetical protein